MPLIRCFTISVHEGLSTIYFLVPETADAGDGLQSVSPGRAVAQWAVKNAVVNEIAHAHNISAAQVLLAWVISHQGVMAIPKAATIAHVQQNAAVLEVELSSAELAMLDKAYPAPKGKLRWIWCDVDTCRMRRTRHTTLTQINVSQREWIAPDVQVSLW